MKILIFLTLTLAALTLASALPARADDCCCPDDKYNEKTGECE